MRLNLTNFMAGLSLAVVVLGAVRPAEALPVVVWDDPAFVDTVGTPAFSESDTIQATLTLLGHSVSTFTGTSAAAWSAALSGASLVVIPETEVSGSTFTALSAGGGAAVLHSFVTASGGGLITAFDLASFGSSDSILNGVFGLGLSVGGSGFSATLTGAAVGTPFAGGPAVIPGPSATVGYTLTSVASAGGVSIYDNGTSSTVATFTAGSGNIVALGWDWFNAAPLGSQDGGWVSVLDSAVIAASASNAVPEPTSMALFGLTALGMGVAARRRRRRRGDTTQASAVA